MARYKENHHKKFIQEKPSKINLLNKKMQHEVNQLKID